MPNYSNPFCCTCLANLCTVPVRPVEEVLGVTRSPGLVLLNCETAICLWLAYGLAPVQLWEEIRLAILCTRALTASACGCNH